MNAERLGSPELYLRFKERVKQQLFYVKKLFLKEKGSKFSLKNAPFDLDICVKVLGGLFLGGLLERNSLPNNCWPA